MILSADSENPDQTAQMHSLIWVFPVCACPEDTFLHGALICLQCPSSSYVGGCKWSLLNCQFSVLDILHNKTYFISSKVSRLSLGAKKKKTIFSNGLPIIMKYFNWKHTDSLRCYSLKVPIFFSFAHKKNVVDTRKKHLVRCF